MIIAQSIELSPRSTEKSIIFLSLWISPHFKNGLVGWLVGFLTSSSTTRLYRGRAPRQSVWQFYVLPHMRQSWETMTSISAGHIILTPTQPVGSGRPQRGSNPGHPDQESRALPTELPRPLKNGCSHSVTSKLWAKDFVYFFYNCLDDENDIMTISSLKLNHHKNFLESFMALHSRVM